MWTRNSLVALAVVLVGFGSVGFALTISDSELGSLSFNYTNDTLGDYTGNNNYEMFGIGHAIAGGYLYAAVLTNFPVGGLVGNDSYANNVHIDAGDLMINVGGSFQTGTGSVYGVATTTHANVAQQAYGGQVWTNVTAGKLYSGADFATGTYERYQEARPNFDPDDGDGNNKVNSYPTLIKTGTEVAGDVSGVRVVNSVGTAWKYAIYYKVDLASLGIADGESVQLFWAMECGNDGAQHTFNKAVPEPTTMALVAAGVAALAAHRRRA